MLCEGLRVKGNLGDSEEAREQDDAKGCESRGIWEIRKKPVSKTSRKVSHRGGGKAGALEIERVSFWFTGVKGQRQGMQGLVLEIVRVPLS